MPMRAKLFVWTIAVALSLMASQTMARPKCDTLNTALEYIAKRYPLFDPAGLKQVISEQDNLWELTYGLPEGMLGGAPIITIEKRTCTIVRARHTQ
jgi:hypothetical protein